MRKLVSTIILVSLTSACSPFQPVEMRLPSNLATQSARLPIDASADGLMVAFAPETRTVDTSVLKSGSHISTPSSRIRAIARISNSMEPKLQNLGSGDKIHPV